MKIKYLLAIFLCLIAFQACSNKSASKIELRGAYDELFEDDGSLVPINSAQIQRQIDKEIKR